MRINKAPIKQPMMNEGSLTNSWQTFFSSIGDALNGEWSNSEWKPTISNCSDTFTAYYIPHGNLLYVSIDFASGINTSTSTLTLPFSCRKGSLLITQSNTLLTDIVAVDGTTMTFPDLTSPTATVVAGVLGLEVTDNRQV